MSNWKDGKSGKERARARQKAAARDEANAGGGSKETKDWRKKGAAAARRNKKNERSWTDRKKDPTSGKRILARVQVWGLGLVLFGLIGYLLYVYLLKVSRTQVIGTSMRSGAGEFPYSTNSHAKEALSGFARADEDFNGNTEYIPEPTPVLFNQDPELDKFVSEHGLFGGGPNKNALILYFSGVGLVDDEGEPVFLDLSQSPYQSRNWKPIRRLLSNVKDLAEGDFLRSKGRMQILVLIDSKRMEPQVSPHLMVDEFADAVRKVYDDSELGLADAGIHVLLSHDVGQRSWVAPELGNSVFAHYAARGIAGDADKNAHNSTEDKVITLKELAEYVRGRVSDWASRSRGVQQTPVFLTGLNPAKADDDIELMKVKYSDVADFSGTSMVSKVAERVSGVQDAWQELDNTMASEGVDLEYMIRVKPYAMARFHACMIRLESMLPYSDSLEFDVMLKQAGTIRTDMFNMRNLIATRELTSLTEAVALQHFSRELGDDRRPVQEALVKSAVEQWNKIRDMDEGDDRIKAVDEFKGQTLFQLAQGVPERAELFAWMWLRSIEDGPDQAMIQEAMTLVQDVWRLLGVERSPHSLTWTEIKWLQLLDRYAAWDTVVEGEDYRGQTLRQAVGHSLECRELSEQVWSTVDPRAFAWIERELEGLDGQRRIADDLLSRSETVSQALDIYQIIRSRYETLSEAAASISETLRVHDEALYKIPYLIAWNFRELSMHQQDPESEEVLRRIANLRRLAELSHQLGYQVYKSLRNSERQNIYTDIAEMADNELVSLLRDAEDVYDDKCQELTSTNAPTELALVEIYNALMCPLASTNRRRQLHDRFVTILESLDKGDQLAGKASQAPDPLWGPEQINSYHARAGETAPDPEINPFGMNDSRIKDSLIGFLRITEFRHWDQFDDAQLSNLNRVWVEDETALTTTENRDRLFGLDHFARLVAPLYAEQTKVIPAFSVKLDMLNQDVYELAQAENALNDFWGNGVKVRIGSRVERPFYFSELADVHIDEVHQIDKKGRPAVVQTLRDKRVAAADRLRDRGNLWIKPVTNELFGPQQYALPLEVDINMEDGFPDSRPTLRIVRVVNGREQPIEFLDRGNNLRRKRELVQDGESAMTDIQLTQDIPISGIGENRLEFLVVYEGRGHESATPFYSELEENGRPEAFTEVNFAPEDPAPAEITVTGNSRSRTDVLIIIDCSGSMGAEFTRGEASVTRFDEAARIAKTLINRMEEAGSYRVALMAYGHIVGQVDQRTGEVAYRRRDPRTNTPLDDAKALEKQIGEWRGKGIELGTDVEVLFGLNQSSDLISTEDDFKRLREFFVGDRLRAWGFTPLYLAMREAGKHLEQHDNGAAEQQIIVITDGLNYQGTRVSANNESRIVSIDDIANRVTGDENEIASLQGRLRQTRIHMVLYNVAFVEGKPFEKRSTFDQHKGFLEQLASRHGDAAKKYGGLLFDTGDAESIIREVDRFVPRTRFELATIDGNPTAPPIELGNTWSEFIRQGGPHRITVNGQQIVTKELGLYGGEKLDLELRNIDSLRFVPRPINTTEDQDVEMAGQQYVIGRSPNNPSQQQFALEFEFRADDPLVRVADRPDFVALRVRPNDVDISDRTAYELYDYQFVHGRQTPTVRFARIPLPVGTMSNMELYVIPRGQMPAPPVKINVAGQIAAGGEDTVPVDGDLYTVRRGEESVVVEFESSGGPVKPVLVTCHVVPKSVPGGRTPERAMLTAPDYMTVKRQYSNENKNKVIYTFKVDPVALAEQRVEIHFDPFDHLFNNSRVESHRLDFRFRTQ